MTEPITEEESLFWGAVQVLQGSGSRQQQCAPSLCGLQSKVKGNRCGECSACLRDDCGSCLNCRDKPKFGGRGARKQACVMRTCAKPWFGSSTSEPDEGEELSDSTSSDEIASPLGLQPSQPLALPPPLPSAPFHRGEQEVGTTVPVDGARGNPAPPALPQMQQMQQMPQMPQMPHFGLSPPIMPVAPAYHPANFSSPLSPPLKAAPLHAIQPNVACAFKLSSPSSIASTAKRPACATGPRGAAADLGGFSFGMEWLRKYEAATRAIAGHAPAETFFGKDILLREAMLQERQRVIAAVYVERRS